MTLTLTPESEVHDEGSIILFDGWDENGDMHRFAVDRRPALDIINALQSGEVDEIQVDVEPWQLVGGR